MSHKHAFRRFLEADPERIHFAAHSHHLWPDVTFDAHVEAWLDAARLADRKWERVFGELIPRAQRHVAARLAVPDAATVVFAPNTHELLVRILSCLPYDRPLRVLTSDAEFHSFARQASRLEEDGLLQITRVPAAPFASFAERFAAAANGPWDLVWVSHVFFNSGYAVPELRRIALAAPREAYVVVDGYHAFGAIPIDVGALAERVFYLGGGYKYAMAGEGACFAHVPPGFGARPRDTGWFAAFGALERSEQSERRKELDEDEQAPGAVPYAPGGARFYGATFDPTPLYRFVAAMDWLDAEGLTPAVLHAHSVKMQEAFVAGLRRASLPLREEQLVVPLTEPSRGQFLTFETKDAAAIHARLLEANVITDVRGDRLRFGFGIYHDEADVERGLARMVAALG